MYFAILASEDLEFDLPFFGLEATVSGSMIEPSRFQVNVTLGVPCARQMSLAEKPDSEADFEMRGDRSMTGLSIYWNNNELAK